MCGICGIFGRNEPDTLEAMLTTLTHRGPDDSHVVTGDDFGLGARRLSIMDPNGGRQPLANETGSIWAVQNGEIYNYRELRARLLERGHQFATRCDTEILPHLYEDHGVDLPTQIDGMFAIAVWDSSRKTGLLARDRMGKKPLYYHQRGDALYFASELKALLKIPGFDRQVNLEALHHYLSFKHVPHPLSIFEGVSILPPAHRLIFRPGEEPEIQRYWELDFSGSDDLNNDSEDELTERLLELLRQGVKRRFMSDVPIGFFLSGGIDSSLSTALAAEQSGGKIKTFTLTYGNESTTEGKEQDRRWARWVAEKYETEHHEESVQFADFPASIRQILRCFDEPFAGVVSTFFLSQLISQHVKVAVAGDGADELFGSYLPHRLATPLANFPQFQQTQDASLIRPFENQTDFLERIWDSDDAVWRSKLLVYEDEEKHGLYSSEIAEEMRRYSTLANLRKSFGALTARDPLNRILEAEYQTIFPDQVLTFVDRLSMAHSLEVRSAFMDTDLVEFVAGLPGHLKIKNGETKYLLKQAGRAYFPEEMVARPKEGFLMPVTQWILNDLQPYVRETLSAERLNRHGFFNPKKVAQMVDDLYSGDADYRKVNKVLALVIFQEWHEIYLP